MSNEGELVRCDLGRNKGGMGDGDEGGGDGREWWRREGGEGSDGNESKKINQAIT